MPSVGADCSAITIVDVTASRSNRNAKVKSHNLMKPKEHPALAVRDRRKEEVTCHGEFSSPEKF